MSKELFVTAVSGLNLYVVLLDPLGQAWNGSWCEELNPGNWSSYSIPLTQVAPTTLYFGNMPSGLDSGVYKYLAYQQINLFPTATDLLLGVGTIRWAGTGVEPVRADNELRDVFGLTDPDLSAQLSDITDAVIDISEMVAADAIGDAVLLRDWTGIDDNVPNRSALNALRFLRNAWEIDPLGNLTVLEENDITVAWQATLMTGAGASPVTGSYPITPPPPEGPM